MHITFMIYWLTALDNSRLELVVSCYCKMYLSKDYVYKATIGMLCLQSKISDTVFNCFRINKWNGWKCFVLCSAVVMLDTLLSLHLGNALIHIYLIYTNNIIYSKATLSVTYVLAPKRLNGSQCNMADR